MDLTNVVTLVKVKELERLLWETKYNKNKSKFLIEGFSKGFSLEYDGPRDIQQTVPNLKLKDQKESVILWNKVMKEVKLKRFAGPFKKPRFEFYIQSPIGLVPKDDDDHRLIFHLSYPRGTGKCEC